MIFVISAFIWFFILAYKDNPYDEDGNIKKEPFNPGTAFWTYVIGGICIILAILFLTELSGLN